MKIKKIIVFVLLLVIIKTLDSFLFYEIIQKNFTNNLMVLEKEKKNISYNIKRLSIVETNITLYDINKRVKGNIKILWNIFYPIIIKIKNNKGKILLSAADRYFYAIKGETIVKVYKTGKILIIPPDKKQFVEYSKILKSSIRMLSQLFNNFLRKHEMSSLSFKTNCVFNYSQNKYLRNLYMIYFYLFFSVIFVLIKIFNKRELSIGYIYFIIMPILFNPVEFLIRSHISFLKLFFDLNYQNYIGMIISILFYGFIVKEILSLKKQKIDKSMFIYNLMFFILIPFILRF